MICALYQVVSTLHTQYSPTITYTSTKPSTVISGQSQWTRNNLPDSSSFWPKLSLLFIFSYFRPPVEKQVEALVQPWRHHKHVTTRDYRSKKTRAMGSISQVLICVVIYRGDQCFSIAMFRNPQFKRGKYAAETRFPVCAHKQHLLRKQTVPWKCL